MFEPRLSLLKFSVSCSADGNTADNLQHDKLPRLATRAACESRFGFWINAQPVSFAHDADVLKPALGPASEKRLPDGDLRRHVTCDLLRERVDQGAAACGPPAPCRGS